tara:strand:- start:1544 stop:1801 length:258 start_codon:yes stop_codon:yes gene_type:complete
MLSDNNLYVYTILSIIPPLSLLPSFLPSFLLMGGQKRGKLETIRKWGESIHLRWDKWVKYRFASNQNYGGNMAAQKNPYLTKVII